MTMSDSSLLHTTHDQSVHGEDIEGKKTIVKLLSLEASNPLERASVFHTSGAFVHTFSMDMGVVKWLGPMA